MDVLVVDKCAREEVALACDNIDNARRQIGRLEDLVQIGRT